MGTVTKTIGTSSRDYSTIQAWEDALPANLVTDGNAQVGTCYNDSEFTAGTLLVIAGETVNATNFITLKCAAGQSFNDNANVQTNALRYNQTNGVACRSTTLYATTIDIQVDFTVLQDLQIGCNATNGSGLNQGSTSRTSVVVDRCLIDCKSPGANGAPVVLFSGGKIRNSLVINRASTGTGNGVRTGYATTCGLTNLTVVRPSDLTIAGAAFSALSGGTVTLKNCAAFGFTNEVNVAARFTATTCATDVASPMTGFTGSLTYTSQFVTTTDASRDFRAKTGGGLIDTGTTDATNGTPDIAKTARPSGASYDIGCWEYVQAAAGFIAQAFAPVLQAVKRASVY